MDGWEVTEAGKHHAGGYFFDIRRTGNQLGAITFVFQKERAAKWFQATAKEMVEAGHSIEIAGDR